MNEEELKQLKPGDKVRLNGDYARSLPSNFGIRLKSNTVTIRTVTTLGFTFIEGTYKYPIMRAFEHPLRCIKERVLR